MAIIIYNSNTGTTEKYAQALSAKTGFECISYAKSQSVCADEEIIFMSWVMAGTLDKFKEVKEKFTNIKSVCAVGMLTSDKDKEKLIEKNLIESETFMLIGAFDMKKLKGMYKMMMSMMMKMIKSQSKGNDKQEEMIKMFENGFDLYDEEKLQPVLEFLA